MMQKWACPGAAWYEGDEASRTPLQVATVRGPSKVKAECRRRGIKVTDGKAHLAKPVLAQALEDFVETGLQGGAGCRCRGKAR